MARQAVGVALAGEGRPQITLVTNPRQAQAAGVGLVVAAVHPAALVPAAAHAVVAGIALHTFGMDGDVACACGDVKGTGLFACCAVATQLDIALKAFVRNSGGNLAVQHINHPTHGAAAVHQGRWAAQHLDLLGQHGLDTHSMVGAHGGCVVYLRAVGQDAHTGPVHAPDDGTAGPRTEVAGAYAGFTFQRFT